MSTSDCSAFANNPGCLGVVCYNDWSSQRSEVAQIARDTYCRPIPLYTGVTCGTCTNTTLGNACCQRNDWAPCFADLAKKSCSDGGAPAPSDVASLTMAASGAARPTSSSMSGAAAPSSTSSAGSGSGAGSNSNSNSNVMSGGSPPVKVGGVFAVALLALSMITGTMALM